MDFLLEAEQLELNEPLGFRQTHRNRTYQARIVNGESVRRHIPWMAIITTRSFPDKGLVHE